MNRYVCTCTDMYVHAHVHTLLGKEGGSEEGTAYKRKKGWMEFRVLFI